MPLFSFRPLNDGFAPLPDLLPRSLEWPLFARKRSLRGVIEPRGYRIPETEAARVQARHRKVKNQLDRFRVEKFWDRVMQEIAEFIAERGPFTSDEILPELRTWTVRGAALYKEPLTASASTRPSSEARKNGHGLDAGPGSRADHDRENKPFRSARILDQGDEVVSGLPVDVKCLAAAFVDWSSRAG